MIEFRFQKEIYCFYFLILYVIYKLYKINIDNLIFNINLYKLNFSMGIVDW